MSQGEEDYFEPVHIKGVWWYDAPIPSRWHRCWAQTSGYIRRDDGYVYLINRCACGGIQSPFSYNWFEKNSRRRDNRRRVGR